MLSDEMFALFTKWRVGRLRQEAQGGLRGRGLRRPELRGEDRAVRGGRAGGSREQEDREGGEAGQVQDKGRLRRGGLLPSRAQPHPRPASRGSRRARGSTPGRTSSSSPRAAGARAIWPQALGVAACRRLLSVRYVRLNDMFREINVARTEGRLYDAPRRVLEAEPAHHRRLLHHAGGEPGKRGGPLRDTGGTGGQGIHPDRDPARARPVVPEDQLRPVRGLHPEQGRGARQVLGHQGPQHARVHRKAEGGEGEGYWD